MRLDEMTATTLAEGLIRIPPVMLSNIRRLMVRDLLWRMQSRSTDAPAPLKQAIADQAARNNVTIPDGPFNPSHEMTAYRIDMNLEGMDNYRGRAPTKDSITFIMFWAEEKKFNGYWAAEKGHLVMFPMSHDYLYRFPDHRSDPDDIEIGINELMGTVEHELRHMVQTEIIQHPDQLRMKPDYRKHEDDYRTSPIEFDPMIGSAVDDFVKLWTVLHSSGSRKINMKKSILGFTGLARKDPFGTFQPHEFFLSLKHHAPQRYRTAVKKFTTEVVRRLTPEA